MSRSRFCQKKHPCVRCGDCCQGLVCGYAVQERYKHNRTDSDGPCEFLRPAGDGKQLCGLYLDYLAGGQRVRADIMRREVRFGQGCTWPGNPRRQAFMQAVAGI